MRTATAWAPASIGNVGVGFDLLGLAIEGVGDTVEVVQREQAGVQLIEIRGDSIACDAGMLACDAAANTAGIAASAVWEAAGRKDGLALTLTKGAPLGSGMGSSAASAVAGAVAANALLATPLPQAELLDCALRGEAFASKAMHADNVAPSLLGGLVLCPVRQLPACRTLPVPEGLVSVLVHPHLRIDTAHSRAALPTSVPLPDAVEQMGLIAAFVHACHAQDVEWFGSALQDVLIEPHRQASIAGFQTVKSAAIDTGALACSISGSGPSVFAIARRQDAEQIMRAMQAAFADQSIESDAWVSALNAPGAQVVVRA